MLFLMGFKTIFHSLLWNDMSGRTDIYDKILSQLKRLVNNNDVSCFRELFLGEKIRILAVKKRNC